MARFYYSHIRKTAPPPLLLTQGSDQNSKWCTVAHMLIASMCVSFKVLLLIMLEEIVDRTDGQTAEINTISPRF